MNIRSLVMLIALAIALLALPGKSEAQISCRWAGTAPFCNGACSANEDELARYDAIPPHWSPPYINVNPPFGSSCLFGSKALCCASPGRAVGTGCHWSGTAPFCDGECGSDERQTDPPQGSSSGATCVTGHKVYCCPKAGVIRQPLAGNDCTYGPGTCAQGFVWREAFPGDHACVTPEVRQQVADDNAQAATRRQPGGGAFGPDTCRQGFVWRGAIPDDHVCVTPAMRDMVAMDNQWMSARNACPGR